MIRREKLTSSHSAIYIGGEMESKSGRAWNPSGRAYNGPR